MGWGAPFDIEFVVQALNIQADYSPPISVDGNLFISPQGKANVCAPKAVLSKPQFKSLRGYCLSKALAALITIRLNPARLLLWLFCIHFETELRTEYPVGSDWWSLALAKVTGIIGAAARGEGSLTAWWL
jgi:hypothetical protein